MNHARPLDRRDLEQSFDIGRGSAPIDEQIMATGRVAVSDYTSAGWLEKERALFARVWLNIGREEEVAAPGDWIVRDIAFLSTSILIARDKSGQLRAFHNVCRHRAMKLVWQRQGNGSAFVCPYHAWRYGADGRLTTVPDQNGFPALDKNAMGLVPIALDVWEGFIFINLSPSPEQSLRDYLRPLSDRIADASFDKYPLTAIMRERLDANWKLAMEAQSENYHIRVLHNRTVSSMMSTSENPFCHVLNWEALGAHGTYSSPANPAFSPSAGKIVQAFAFRSASFLNAAGAEGDNRAGFGSHGGFNPADADLWGADQITIFPNFLLNVSPNGWWLHRFWPVTPDQTDWEAIYYFRRPESARGRFALEYFIAFNRDTLMEDMTAVRAQQSAMRSGAVTTIHFGEQETACRHIAAVMNSAIRSVTEDASE
jgi:phenylpropionate dioxygenase-like ring-hydroxylating dioxygenase large terminal subunit